MVDQETLRKAQLKMVEILKVIDDICQRHDIKYWLCYGTLLGAVRHKGFIPWDDDCDICMMREDFEKFSKYVDELPENLFLQSKKTDKYYTKNMIKIRMKGTKLVEFEEKENEKYHQGIFVDIFVWDYHPDCDIIFGKFFRTITWMRLKRKYHPKGSFKRAWIQMYSAVPYFFRSLFLKIHWLGSFAYRKITYIGQELLLCDWKLFTKDMIFPLQKDVVFEGKTFYVPKNYDVLLKRLYGDYMILPKPENRRWHAKQIEV